MNIGSRFSANLSILVVVVSCLLGILFVPGSVDAARLKDIATVKGVRENILIGYGIVVGLNGTGDSSTDVTNQSLTRLFGKLGLDIRQDTAVKSKNAAAVIVTASLPPFARVGNKIDIKVSSIGDATSLEGGTLLVTPLRAGDQNVYAVAQGTVSIGATTDGAAKVFPTVGRVVAGATIEKDIDTNFAAKKSFRLALHNPDFTTVSRMVSVINGELGGKFASARDSGTIDVVVPFNYEGNTVELLAILENVQVNVDSRAKVVLNERTGTVVMGDNISISPVAISHGDLAIEVAAPAGQDGGTPAQGGNNNSKDKRKERVIYFQKEAKVADLVKVLNTLGVTPKDLTAIFQTMKKVGALQAELEIM